ncbi:hypothetical protein Golax_005167, partial [Gossypium laxum]|nr:hypothetical protein [Gossypium laxum]
ELKEVWVQWDDEVKQLFYSNYGDLPYLLDIKVDLVPTMEEYTALLRCPGIQVDKAYSRAVNVPTFVKKLMNITRMSEQWVTTVTPVPAILAKTFRSLNACRRTGDERFIGCAQLLLAWFHSHFWKVDKVSYQ